MTQTTGRFFDELAKLMTNAAGAARGVRSEVDSVMRAQAERVLNDLDIVNREEFEAVREMAVKAREENERLATRIAELEARLADASADTKVRKPARKPAKSPRSRSAKTPS